MSTATDVAARPPTLGRVRARWAHPAIVANLVAQIAIVVTGGAVRLTGSGLGCSTWPQCEPGHFTPQAHDATSIHPYIEFGNRTLTGVLIAIAGIVAVLVWSDRTRPVGYRRLGLAPVAGVLVQAVLGGITVLVKLNPAVVASHLLISMALIAASTWLLLRSRDRDGPVRRSVDARTVQLSRALVGLAVVVLALGVVVTGAGPHSGDDQVGYRFAIDPVVIARVHSAAVGLFVVTLVALIVRLRRAVTALGDPATARAGLEAAAPAELGRAVRVGRILLAVTLAQGLIGYVQLLTGLPELVVLTHMLGAALLTAAVTWFVATLRTRTAIDAAD